MKKYNESAMMQKMSLKEMNDVNGGNPVAIKAARISFRTRRWRTIG